MAQPSYPCPRCSGGLTWLAQYSKWYCHACAVYPYDAPAPVAAFPAKSPTAPGAAPASATSSTPSSAGPKCSTCQGELSYIAEYKAWYCHACQKYGAVADPKHAMAKCPTCSSQLSYSTDQQRWYCYTCKRYVGEEKEEDARAPAATHSPAESEKHDIAAAKTHSAAGTEASPVQITIVNSPSAGINAPDPQPQPILVEASEAVPQVKLPPPAVIVEAAPRPEVEKPRVEVGDPAVAKETTPTALPPASSPTTPPSTPAPYQRPAAASPSPFAPPGTAARPAATPTSASAASTSPRPASTPEDFLMSELRRSKIPRKETAPAKAERAPEVRRETVIEDVFLLYRDGRLIRHYTRRIKPTVDSDMLSSMIVAVSAFVKDSFGQEDEGTATLDEIKYGALRIHLARGKYLTVAMLIQGDDAEGLVGQARGKIREIETLLEPLVKDWDGKVNTMQPVHKHIEALFG